MAYELKKVKNGYYVVSVETGKKHSKRPLSKAKAEAQLRILLKNLDKEQAQNQGDIIAYPLDKRGVMKVENVVRKEKQRKELEELANKPQSEEEYLRVQRRHQSINRMLDNPEFMEHLRDVDPLGYHKLINMPDEMIEGGGLFDFLKSAGQKVKDLASNVGQRIVGTFTGRRLPTC